MANCIHQARPERPIVVETDAIERVSDGTHEVGASPIERTPTLINEPSATSEQLLAARGAHRPVREAHRRFQETPSEAGAARESQGCARLQPDAVAAPDLGHGEPLSVCRRGAIPHGP